MKCCISYHIVYKAGENMMLLCTYICGCPPTHIHMHTHGDRELGNAYIITSSHFTVEETDSQFEGTLSMSHSLICKYFWQS